jgi:hypothetical protein
MNYERKKRKNNELKQPLTRDNVDILAVLKGEIGTEKIWEKIEESEQKIAEISEKTDGLNQQNKSYQKEISETRIKIQTLKDGDLQKLSSFAQMSDYSLFNNYLNTEYLNAKKNNDSFADFKLKSETDLKNSINKQYQLQIESYRIKINAKIDLFNSQIAQMENVINEKEQLIKINSDCIKENLVQLRFWESRVLKYEALFFSKG